MRRKLHPAGMALFIAVLLSSTNHLHAQSNVSLSDQMDDITAPLDFTDVTSGLLLDRGFFVVCRKGVVGKIGVRGDFGKYATRLYNEP